MEGRRRREGSVKGKREGMGKDYESDRRETERKGKGCRWYKRMEEVRKRGEETERRVKCQNEERKREAKKDNTKRDREK